MANISVASKFAGLTIAFNQDLTKQTADFFSLGLEGATNTQTAYRSDINQLRQWLAVRKFGGLPISSLILAVCMSGLASIYKWATLSRRTAAIRKWHKLHKYPDQALDDTVQTVLEGIKRSISTDPTQAPAFEIEDFKEKIRLIPFTPAGLYDRALLLVGFVGAFRRSELVALKVEGIQFPREGAFCFLPGQQDQPVQQIRVEGALF